MTRLTASGKKEIIISGGINNPGTIEINDETTLLKIIELAGGLLNNNKFKVAQVGLPFGDFYTSDKLEKKISVNCFEEPVCRFIIILSENDCIIQYAKFYLELVLGKMDEGYFESFMQAKSEISNMLVIPDRISKGKGNMRDIYVLREHAQIIKAKTGMKHNLVEEIIEEFYEEIREHIEDNKCSTLRCNHLTKLTITQKCIGCGRCKTVCPVDCIEGEFKKHHYIDYNRCTHCGACLTSCPVQAITAGNNTPKFLRDLAITNKIVITQMAPAVRVAIGEAFGFEPGINVQNKIAAALRKLGVKYVFDTTWAADLTIMEEATEFQERLERYLAGDKEVRLPILTSCCPAWVKFIEQNYGDMLDVPSSVKPPMQIFATVLKDLWAKENGIPRDKIISVAIMPCIAKKYEASRPEFSRGLNYDVDYVITTNELIEIFKKSNIDLNAMEGEEIDKVLGEYSGAGIIFGRTGGVIEATTRTAVEKMTGKKLENVEFTTLRGWDGFRSCDVEVNNIKLRIGVAHGLKEAGKMLDKIRSGEEFYHAIEIMACKGGCVGGGGQPRAKKREETLKARMEGLNDIDRKLDMRVSNENHAVQAIYDKFLDYPLSHKAHELLHTKYFIRRKK